MFVINISYKVPFEKIEPYFEAHIKFVRKYVEKEIFFLTGKKIPRSGGLIISNAGDKDTLLKILSEDPFWEFDLADFGIQEIQLSQVSERLLKL